MTTAGATTEAAPRNVRSELHRVVAADGVELALTRFSADSGAGVPVLLTHGTFSNGAICSRLGAYLAGHGFDSWVLELRGRGQSQRVIPEPRRHYSRARWRRRCKAAWRWGPAPGNRCAGSARRPTRSRPDDARLAWKGSACTRMCRCRRGGGISWRGSAATFCARPWPWSDSRGARVGSSCISFAGPGATAPRRCSSIPWSCWGAWRPSYRRRADLCWPTMGSSARGRAGDRPSFRSHRRPPHGETSTRAPRGAGPGLGSSSGCSALMCWCAIAAGAGGGSSAR